jgi:3-methyladenine DNA glycosylase AlkD
MQAEDVKKDLRNLANFEKANLLQRFFKTGKGDYGEGDVFLGVMVPNTRKIAQKYTYLNLKEINTLLNSKIHEERLCALLIMVKQYFKLDELNKKKLFNFYIKNAKQINNWDLVDLSAPKIVGGYLLDKPRSILYKFSKSKNLWERRISILSTFAFIKAGDYSDSFRLTKILMNDKHDLIHKAVGWMLREIGKKSMKDEIQFLNKHYKKMPRTMLRYAIERFPEVKRQFYLKKQ